MNIAGLHLEKPLMNASGTLSRWMVREVKDLYGAVVTKTVTLEPRAGNPPPRMAEVPCGMINSIGLQNVGIEKFLAEELDEWCSVGLPVIVSIGGKSDTEFRKLSRILSTIEKVAAIELNLSCPNWEGEGFCDWPTAVGRVVLRCCGAAPRTPVIAKLALNNYLANSEAAARVGADALTLINSIPSMAYINGKALRGGQSGPGIKGMALRAVDEVSRVVDIPVIGCGGAWSAKDIEEFMWAGASAVQIGSASFVREPGEILTEERRGGEMNDIRFRLGDHVRLLKTKNGYPTRDAPVGEVVGSTQLPEGSTYYIVSFSNGLMHDVPQEHLVRAWVSSDT